MIEQPLSKQLWHDLRLPVLLLLLVVGIGLGIDFVAVDFSNQQQRAYQQQQRQWRTLDQRYLSLVQDEQRIKAWLPAFEKLRQRGFIGEEDRLKWINALYKAAARAQLPFLRHRFDAQRDYVSPLVLPKGFTLRASNMSIEAELLHEEDLLHLLYALDRYTDALYQLQQCLLQYKAAPAQSSARGNLVAVCKLDWITGLINHGK